MAARFSPNLDATDSAALMSSLGGAPRRRKSSVTAAILDFTVATSDNV